MHLSSDDVTPEGAGSNEKQPGRGVGQVDLQSTLEHWIVSLDMKSLLLHISGSFKSARDWHVVGVPRRTGMRPLEIPRSWVSLLSPCCNAVGWAHLPKVLRMASYVALYLFNLSCTLCVRPSAEWQPSEACA